MYSRYQDTTTSHLTQVHQILLPPRDEYFFSQQNTYENGATHPQPRNKDTGDPVLRRLTFKSLSTHLKFLNFSTIRAKIFIV